ncbi:hypothetical protein AUN14_02645 [Cronobacter muytjensii]|uniref:Uncharacterized protein n=1 Tax=Cronobacter muytjensii TaxID=413501 RepID=A0A2T7AYB8_9ENTR|nr:hypothetical protein [Cronobacter muytjensii]PUX17587.1 hypothetical protein AUN14_02645 [Cronobacter muytjensii]
MIMPEIRNACRRALKFIMASYPCFLCHIYYLMRHVANRCLRCINQQALAIAFSSYQVNISRERLKFAVRKNANGYLIFLKLNIYANAGPKIHQPFQKTI